jgi:hypothetical protein
MKNMSILYDSPQKMQRDSRIVYLGPKTNLYGQVMAVRVKDLTRNIWYSWDEGQGWNNAGGTGTNAPVGEAPRCTNGGGFYIAAYVRNEGFSVVLAAIWIDGVGKAAKSSGSQDGVQVEYSQSMPITGNVQVQIVGGPQTPASTVNFTITGISQGGSGGVTQVMVIDAITKNPIVGAVLTSGSNVATTDNSGSASITSMGIIQAEASGYLPSTTTILSNVTTLTTIMLWPIWAIGVGVGGAMLAIGGVAYVLTRKK